MKNETCLELKYCERCGGLWLRECGAGQVYCERCLPILDELPPPSKHIVRLPSGPGKLSDDDFDFEINDIDAVSWPAVGGAA